MYNNQQQTSSMIIDTNIYICKTSEEYYVLLSGIYLCVSLY